MAEQNFEDLLRQFDDDGRRVDMPIPVWTAMLVAVGMTLAEMDFTPLEQRTAQNFLNRVHWFLENPSRDMPTLVLSEERGLRIIEQMLSGIVDLCQDRMSNQPPLPPDA